MQAGLTALPPERARTILTAAGITVAQVNRLDEVWNHEQLRARGRFVEVDVMGTPTELLASPFQISGWTPPPGRVPPLGSQ